MYGLKLYGRMICALELEDILEVFVYLFTCLAPALVPPPLPLPAHAPLTVAVSTLTGHYISYTVS